MPVLVFSDHDAGETLRNETKRIAEYVLTKEGRKAEIGIVFVDEIKIKDLNRNFLKHDFVTDVISFPLDETEGVVEGEVYVCIDQAVRQARQYGVSMHREVFRLVIHGILHLLGYDDATPRKKSVMKQKEDAYLELVRVS
jgi:probable rRNA maturation factor